MDHLRDLLLATQQVHTGALQHFPLGLWRASVLFFDNVMRWVTRPRIRHTEDMTLDENLCGSH